MDCITLQNVDESNFLACFSLELDAQQEKFVSHPIRSLAQAYVYRGQCTPFAVCRAGEVVGYLMVIYDYDEEAYFIWHLMIDARHQGRGYGRESGHGGGARLYPLQALWGFQHRPADRQPGKFRCLSLVPDPALLCHRPGGRG